MSCFLLLLMSVSRVAPGLLYRYKVPKIARHKRRCHALRCVLEKVFFEAHGDLPELKRFDPTLSRRNTCVSWVFTNRAYGEAVVEPQAHIPEP